MFLGFWVFQNFTIKHYLVYKYNVFVFPSVNPSLFLFSCCCSYNYFTQKNVKTNGDVYVAEIARVYCEVQHYFPLFICMSIFLSGSLSCDDGKFIGFTASLQWLRPIKIKVFDYTRHGITLILSCICTCNLLAQLLLAPVPI